MKDNKSYLQLLWQKAYYNTKEMENSVSEVFWKNVILEL